MRFSGRNLLTLLLIVVMAMPALSPPALRHTHADGDRSHDHRVAATDHEHTHSHGPTHSHSPRHSQRHAADLKTAKHSHNGCEGHSATPHVEHFHVFGFGFTTSLPLPAPERSDSPRAIPNVDQWVPLISEVPLPDTSQDGLNVLVAELCTPATLTPRMADRSEIRPLRQSAVNLLCDTARRERSGVLVI